MLLSMTGYGRVSQPFRDKVITIEIRSLNSKFTDVKLKTPINYREKETDLRRIVMDRLERGKIDMMLEVKSMQGDDEVSLNKGLFRRYYQELSQLAGELQIDTGDIMQTILRLPNVVVTESESIDEEEWQAVIETLSQALTHFDQFRMAEGGAMENDLRLRINNIMSLLNQINPYEGERVTRLRQRLNQNLEEFLGKENVDENRFEQEVLFYLEKIDITEEKVRLEQHCKYFLEELDLQVMSKGRKLSFISQEMGREINTLGAKAYSSEIQRYVVTMKDELEKIKEQVANSV